MTKKGRQKFFGNRGQSETGGCIIVSGGWTFLSKCMCPSRENAPSHLKTQMSPLSVMTLDQPHVWLYGSTKHLARHLTIYYLNSLLLKVFLVQFLSRFEYYCFYMLADPNSVRKGARRHLPWDLDLHTFN